MRAEPGCGSVLKLDDGQFLDDFDIGGPRDIDSNSSAFRVMRRFLDDFDHFSRPLGSSHRQHCLVAQDEHGLESAGAGRQVKDIAFLADEAQ